MSLKVEIRPASVPKVLNLSGANVFLHEGKLVIGYGVAAQLTATGEKRIESLGVQWQELVENAEISDEVSVPGSGLIGLTSITFSPSSKFESVVIVPARTLVIQDGHCYEVVVGPEEPGQVGSEPEGSFVEGLHNSAGFRDSVE